jgi:hypothetical protein
MSNPARLLFALLFGVLFFASSAVVAEAGWLGASQTAAKPIVDASRQVLYVKKKKHDEDDDDNHNGNHHKVKNKNKNKNNKPESTESSSTSTQGSSSTSTQGSSGAGNQGSSSTSSASAPTGQAAGTGSKDGTLLLPYFEVDVNKPGAGLQPKP